MDPLTGSPVAATASSATPPPSSQDNAVRNIALAALLLFGLVFLAGAVAGLRFFILPAMGCGAAALAISGVSRHHFGHPRSNRGSSDWEWGGLGGFSHHASSASSRDEGRRRDVMGASSSGGNTYSTAAVVETRSASSSPARMGGDHSAAAVVFKRR